MRRRRWPGSPPRGCRTKLDRLAGGRDILGRAAVAVADRDRLAEPASSMTAMPVSRQRDERLPPGPAHQRAPPAGRRQGQPAAAWPIRHPIISTATDSRTLIAAEMSRLRSRPDIIGIFADCPCGNAQRAVRHWTPNAANLFLNSPGCVCSMHASRCRGGRSLRASRSASTMRIGAVAGLGQRVAAGGDVQHPAAGGDQPRRRAARCRRGRPCRADLSGSASRPRIALPLS